MPTCTAFDPTKEEMRTMGLYIRPAEKVEQQGRPITFGRSVPEMKAQLHDGESAVAVASRPFGKVALLIAHEGDWNAVMHSGCDGLYAISAELAATAS